MARGVNRVTLVGHLGGDPEAKSLPSGDAVCNFSIATTETWKDKDSGDKKEKTEWHRIVAFKKLAEICSQYLKKGSLVYVEGKLRTRTYDKDGQKHYATEIVIDEMQMLDRKPGGSDERAAGQAESYPEATRGRAAAPAAAPAAQSTARTSFEDEDIPF